MLVIPASHPILQPVLGNNYDIRQGRHVVLSGYSILNQKFFRELTIRMRL